MKVGGLQVGARVIPTPTTVSPVLARFIDSAGSMTDYKIPSSAAGWLELRDKQDREFEQLAIGREFP